MKKARLLLTISIFLTVIGGALAYKARGLENTFYMDTLVSGQKRCTVPTVLINQITDFGGRSTLLSTYPTLTACPTIQITNIF